MALVRVAPASELQPGSGTIVEAGGKELALFRIGETFYCIDNECPHSYGPLGFGDVNGEIVTCPWHAWEINVRTGQVVYFPGECVATYHCVVEGDEVFVEV